jgi:hypothetical protein
MSDHRDESFLGGILSTMLGIITWLFVIAALLVLFMWVTRAIAWVLGFILQRPMPKLYPWTTQLFVAGMVLWAGCEGAEPGWLVVLLVILEGAAIPATLDVQNEALERSRGRLYRKQY